MTGLKASNQNPSRSPYESLRLQGSVRAAIIGYGVAGLTLLLARGGLAPGVSAPRQVFYMLVAGLALQAVLFVIRRLTAQYERSVGLEGYLSPLVVYIFELIVDAVTVFLFAWATYRGLLLASDV
jgi:hypothetical protein